MTLGVLRVWCRWNNILMMANIQNRWKIHNNIKLVLWLYSLIIHYIECLVGTTYTLLCLKFAYACAFTISRSHRWLFNMDSIGTLWYWDTYLLQICYYNRIYKTLSKTFRWFFWKREIKLLDSKFWFFAHFSNQAN